MSRLKLIYSRQARIIDLLLKLPKKPILEIVTTIEEEIENIAVDEEQAVSSKSLMNENSRRWSFVLSGKYLFAILIFYIINVVKVYIVVSHVDRTVIVPAIYDVRFLIDII
jgi:hypothetical protein